MTLLDISPTDFRTTIDRFDELLDVSRYLQDALTHHETTMQAATDALIDWADADPETLRVAARSALAQGDTFAAALLAESASFAELSAR